MEVTDFNSLPAKDATLLLTGCLGAPRWVDGLVSDRPYATAPELLERAHDTAIGLDDGELAAALARHPRIGERPEADDEEARYSRAEQSGVSGEHAHRLRDANAAYESRFGHVFLIRAAGRSSEEILTELERRLANDDSDERAETVTALRDIALLRLGQALT